MNGKQTISLIGSVAVLIGCMLPLVVTPGTLAVSYMYSSYNIYGGGTLAVLAILSIIGIISGKDILVLVAACLGVLVFAATMLNLLVLLEETENISSLSFSLVEYKSGAIAITVGLLVMLASSMITGDNRSAHGRPVQRKRYRKSRLKADNIHREQVNRTRRSNSESSGKSSGKSSGQSGSIFKTKSKSRRRSSSRKKPSTRS